MGQGLNNEVNIYLLLSVISVKDVTHPEIPVC